MDPKLTHASDQLIAYFRTLAGALVAYMREAELGGLTREEALRAALAAQTGWIETAMKRSGSDGAGGGHAP